MRQATSWLIRLAVIAACAWYLRPLYAPPAPPQPSPRAPTDSVTWRFYQAGQTNIYQALTVTGDGHTILTIIRKQGDPDMPESFLGVKLHLNRATGIVEFRQENVLPADKAKRVLHEAWRAGVFGLQSVPTSEPDRLCVTTQFNKHEQTATGPADLSATFDWVPSVWVNRIRWQQVCRLLRDYPCLYKRLQKQEIILTDDHGKPIESPPHD